MMAEKSCESFMQLMIPRDRMSGMGRFSEMLGRPSSGTEKSRREVFPLLAGFATSFLLPAEAHGNDTSHTTEQRVADIDAMEKALMGEHVRPLEYTVMESGLLALGNVLFERYMNTYLRSIGSTMRLGNANANDVRHALEAYPAGTFFTEVFEKPVSEEAVFRLGGSLAATHVSGRGMQWGFGIPIAGIFALAHNVTPTSFDTEHLPVPQFLGGVFLWYLMRTYGITHAVTGHAAYNAAWLALLNDTFPGDRS